MYYVAHHTTATVEKRSRKAAMIQKGSQKAATVKKGSRQLTLLRCLLLLVLHAAVMLCHADSQATAVAAWREVMKQAAHPISVSAPAGAPRGSDVMVTLREMSVELNSSLLGKGQVSMVSVICSNQGAAQAHCELKIDGDVVQQQDNKKVCEHSWRC
jgi:hypothetical protein